MANKLENAYGNLATMLDGGVPILKALRTSSKTPGKISRAFKGMADDVDQGATLAGAMKKYPKVFSPTDVQLVDAGETSGHLAYALKELGVWYGVLNEVTRQIRSGLTLPFFIFHFVSFFYPLFKFIRAALIDSHTYSYHQFMMDIIFFLSFLYIPTGLILFIIYFTPKQGPLRWCLDTFVLFIPVMGLAFKRLAISRYCRNFGLCYSSGVPMLKTCEVARLSTGNSFVGSWFKNTEEVVRQGQPAIEGFPRSRLSSDFLSQWEAGEVAGKLEEVTDRLATEYMEKSKTLFKEISIWLPRIVYGIICGFVIYLIFLVAQAYLGAINSVM